MDDRFDNRNKNSVEPVVDGAYRWTSNRQFNHQDYSNQNKQYDSACVKSGSRRKPAARSNKRKRMTGVVAAAVFFALLGGVIGAGSVTLFSGDSDNTTASYTAADVPADTLEISDSGNVKMLNVTVNSEETEMTPQDIYSQYVNAVVAVYNEGTMNYYGQSVETTSSGSGFIITEDGYIVTNNHVVEGAETLTVKMTSGEEYEATLIGADSENDVALIKIDAADLPTVSVGDSDAIQVGEQICAIGNPLGELTNTLTVGYVSALDREIDEDGTPINMFQTDCVINSGNSGGPMFDMHGNVVGITTAKYSSNGSSTTASIEGIGFCIPINDALDIVSDLLEYGYVTGRASLGINAQDISSAVNQYYSLPCGAYVYSVQDGSAADYAGITAGDIVTAIESTEINTVSELRAELKNYSAGDTVCLSIYRTETGEELSVTVTLDEKSAGTADQQVPAFIG